MLKLTRYLSLKEKHEKILSDLQDSICECGLCKTLEKDRIFFSGYEKWYCPDCYEKNHKYWRKSIEEFQDPENLLA